VDIGGAPRSLVFSRACGFVHVVPIDEMIQLVLESDRQRVTL
jgi:hypothetical protein